MTTKTTFNANILSLVFGLSRTVKKEFQAAPNAHELSMIQVQALKEIAHNKHCTMSDVAHQMCIALPTATVLMNKLVNGGFVKRAVKKTDRRSVYLTLTPTGKEKIDEVIKSKIEHAGHILDKLDDQDRKDLERILKNLSQKLDLTS